MLRSLWTGASGMIAQNYQMDVIANNLSNVNTTGYKGSRTDFEDLIYQNQRIAGTPATEQTLTPTPTQVGHGVKVSSTLRDFSQGALQATGEITDVALAGDGFFKVLTPDGSEAYTRDGSFKIDSSGQLVNNTGKRLLPEIILPEGYQRDSLSISSMGEVSVRLAGESESTVVGQMMVYRFINPAGLTAIGENLYKQSSGSGAVIEGIPSVDGMASIAHKFLEMSNTSAISQMTNMIVTQRAYEFNSKTIQTSDSMLSIATNLKR